MTAPVVAPCGTWTSPSPPPASPPACAPSPRRASSASACCGCRACRKRAAASRWPRRGRTARRASSRPRRSTCARACTSTAAARSRRRATRSGSPTSPTTSSTRRPATPRRARSRPTACSATPTSSSTPRARRLIAVREQHGGDGEPVTTIVALDLDGGGSTTLVEGADFYASARVSPEGRRLAWLSWNHPRMPWEGTELWLAAIADDGTLAHARCVAGGPDGVAVPAACGRRTASCTSCPTAAASGTCTGWRSAAWCRCARWPPSSACRNGCSRSRRTASRARTRSSPPAARTPSAACCASTCAAASPRPRHAVRGHRRAARGRRLRGRRGRRAHADAPASRASRWPTAR